MPGSIEGFDHDKRLRPNRASGTEQGNRPHTHGSLGRLRRFTMRQHQGIFQERVELLALEDLDF